MTDVFTDTAGVVRLEGTLTLATGAPAVLVASKTLTSAQLLAIDTNPVTVIAAQGAGTVIVPLGGFVTYNPGATPFDSSDPLVVSWAALDADTPLLTNLNPTDVNAVAASVALLVAKPEGSGILRAQAVNQAAVLFSASAPTVGNGALTLFIFYGVLTV